MARRTAKDCQQYTIDPYITGGKSLDLQEREGDLLDIEFRVSGWLSDVMRRVSMTRAEIAAGMTDAMYPSGGTEVTRQQLESWTRTGPSWRFPLSHLPALQQVTGDRTILQRLAAISGCVVLTGDQAKLAQLGSLAALRRRLDREEAALIKDLPQALLKDIMGRAGGGS